MAVNLSLSPLGGAGWQFFDNNGNPLAGGLLYTYQAGTSTLSATYTSSSGSIQNSNPIVLDSSGRVPNEIWLIYGQGYKFVLNDSNFVQIASWDNIPSNPPAPYPTQSIQQNTTYYVSTTGNDSNDGLTLATAFATIQHAVNVVYAFNFNGYTVTIQVSNGVYTAGASIQNPIIGTGNLYIIGNTTTPDNCVINATSANCFSLSEGASVLITGFKLTTTTSGNCLEANTASFLNAGIFDFGSCAGFHVDCGTGAYVDLSQNYSITGSAVGHLHCGAFGLINGAAPTVTITGTPNFSSYFIGVAQGTVTWGTSTVTGTATGKQYLAHNGGLILSNNAYSNIPGSIAGANNCDGFIVGNNSAAITYAPDIYPGNSLALQSINFNAQTYNNHFVCQNDLFQGTGTFYCNGSGGYSSGLTTFGGTAAVDATTGTNDGVTTNNPSTGYVPFNGSAPNIPVMQLRRRSSDGSIVNFYKDTANVGSIAVSATATAYYTSSDYRLKTVEGSLQDSGNFIDSLKPYVGTWKTDNSKFVGFLAHEVQEVSPTSVLGKKDELDKEGNPVYQSMEYGSAEFIANIVAELQSLRKRVAVLESK